LLVPRSLAPTPASQKVWLQLEEKRVPYRVELINMRSYGDKPEAFLRKVPGGLLPAIELDGQVITESLVIMQRIEQAFPDAPPMLPSDARGLERANSLLRLERELFSDWCQFTFRPGLSAQRGFEATLGRVEAALAETDGPWLLGGERPSLVDLQYGTRNATRRNATQRDATQRHAHATAAPLRRHAAALLPREDGARAVRLSPARCELREGRYARAHTCSPRVPVRPLRPRSLPVRSLSHRADGSVRALLEGSADPRVQGREGRGPLAAPRVVV
jgi:glutathione S-transferase